LDRSQQRQWRALIVGVTLLLDRLDAELRRDFNVSLAEYEVLVRLSENQGQLRMTQLADSVAHSRSRTTHTIKRMEEAGWVTREVSGEDGRGRIARITDQGLALLSASAPAHVQGVRDYLVDLASVEDFTAIGRVFDAVTDRLIDPESLDIRQP
jgi:DNA-binding MarR family transcriptional regulator